MQLFVLLFSLLFWNNVFIIDSLDTSEASGLCSLIDGIPGLLYENWRCDNKVPQQPCNGNWVGVTCTDDTEHILGLDLSMNLLVGSLTSQIGDFPYLKTLFLGNNKITGSIPSQIGKLTNLQSLIINFQKLEGLKSTLPTTLGNLQSLKNLKISYNPLLEGKLPSQIGKLKSLESLEIAYNSISGPIPTELANLKELTYINFYGNGFSGSLQPLMSLTNLRTLVAPLNFFQGPLPNNLGDLVKLTWIDLSSNNISGTIPSQLGNLSDLGILSLDRNELFSSIPESIWSLKQLSLLSLYGNKLTGTISNKIQELKSLRMVDLHRNFFFGTVPSLRDSLTKLVYLNIEDNIFTGCNLEQIFYEANSLAKCDLSTNCFSCYSAEGNQCQVPPGCQFTCVNLTCSECSKNPSGGFHCQGFCGDGILDGTKNCDGGIGCTVDCQCANGYVPTSPISNGCVSICGDGISVPPEKCDGGLGCTDTCTCKEGWVTKGENDCEPLCGDKLVVGNEECDGGDGCKNCLCLADWRPTIPASVNCILIEVDARTNVLYLILIIVAIVTIIALLTALFCYLRVKRSFKIRFFRLRDEVGTGLDEEEDQDIKTPPKMKKQPEEKPRKIPQNDRDRTLTPLPGGRPLSDNLVATPNPPTYHSKVKRSPLVLRDPFEITEISEDSSSSSD